MVSFAPLKLKNAQVRPSQIEFKYFCRILFSLKDLISFKKLKLIWPRTQRTVVEGFELTANTNSTPLTTSEQRNSLI